VQRANEATIAARRNQRTVKEGVGQPLTPILARLKTQQLAFSGKGVEQETNRLGIATPTDKLEDGADNRNTVVARGRLAWTTTIVWCRPPAWKTPLGGNRIERIRDVHLDVQTGIDEVQHDT